MDTSRGFQSSRTGFPASLANSFTCASMHTSQRSHLHRPQFPQALRYSLLLQFISGVVLATGKDREKRALVKHGSVFTRGTELLRNPQALFRCQCTIHAVLHKLEQISTKQKFCLRAARLVSPRMNAGILCRDLIIWNCRIWFPIRRDFKTLR